MKYLVMHYSDNWMMDGLATFGFKTKSEAIKYIKNFKSDSTSHRNDTLRLVKVEEEYEITLKEQAPNIKFYKFKRK